MSNWTERASNQRWQSVASSSDGTKLVACVYGGKIYTSTDSGANWTERASNRNWRSVASSSDGTKLVACVYGGRIYTSSTLEQMSFDDKIKKLLKKNEKFLPNYNFY